MVFSSQRFADCALTRDFLRRNVVEARRGSRHSPETECGTSVWRTSEDPFEVVWPKVQQWLNEKPDALSKDLFERLLVDLPNSFQPGQLRTLQRRVKEWKTTIARQLVLGAETGLPFVSRNDIKEIVFD
jgi:hypothetical protein